jgi:hypothetical protein
LIDNHPISCKDDYVEGKTMTASASSGIANDAKAGGQEQMSENTSQAKKFALPAQSFIDAFDKELMKEVRRQERDNDPKKPPSQMAFLRGKITFLRRAFDAKVPDKKIIQIFKDHNIEISLHTLRAFWKVNKLKRTKEVGVESNGDSGQETSNKTADGDEQNQASAPKEKTGEIVSEADGGERSVHNHGADKKEDGKGNVGSVASGSSLGSDWDDDFEMDDSNAGYKGQ